jgi:hypothetical protein
MGKFQPTREQKSERRKILWDLAVANPEAPVNEIVRLFNQAHPESKVSFGFVKNVVSDARYASAPIRATKEGHAKQQIGRGSRNFKGARITKEDLGELINDVEEYRPENDTISVVVNPDQGKTLYRENQWIMLRTAVNAVAIVGGPDAALVILNAAKTVGMERMIQVASRFDEMVKIMESGLDES